MLLSVVLTCARKAAKPLLASLAHAHLDALIRADLGVFVGLERELGAADDFLNLQVLIITSSVFDTQRLGAMNPVSYIGYQSRASISRSTTRVRGTT